MSCIYIKVRIEAQGHSYLPTRETPVTEESGPPHPVCVIGRLPSAKLLLMGFSQLQQPIRIRFQRVLDHFALDTGVSEVGPDPQRSLAPGGVQADEVLHIAAIIYQPLNAQSIDHVRGNLLGVPPLRQFAA
jgi:hypothetical protein